MLTIPTPVADTAAPLSAADASLADAQFLHIESLTKSFDGVTAVDQISIDIRRGELFALLGSSGCGKSTLLRMLAGFETPSAGRIVLAGVDITDVAPYDRPINMMFQSYALFPHMNVWNNIAFGLKRDGMPKDEIAARVESLLALVQLTPFALRRPHQLSGGQQQRVALARSLAKRPKLLLLDEPLGALDRKLRERTQLELVKIIEQVGVTCVMVTHDQEEAMTMASRIAVMSEGKFLQIGTPAQIYETPNCRFVADFIGNVNLFDGHLVESGSDFAVIESEGCNHRSSEPLSGAPGTSVTLAIRPEKIAVRKSPVATAATGPTEFNEVRARIVDLAYFGSHTVYHLMLADGKTIEASAPNAGRRHAGSLALGDEVLASWSADALVVLAG